MSLAISRSARITALVVWTLAAPSAVPAQPPPEPGPGAHDARSADAEVRRALLSVYFHARIPESGWMPEEVRPIPLRKAVEILRDDRGYFAESRRRRAIAKLYAGPKTRDRTLALRALGAPVQRLDPLVMDADLSEEELTRVGSPALVQVTIELLDKLNGPSIQSCVRTFPQTEVDFSYSDPMTKMVSTMSVKRALDELRPALDPQNWDVCGSKFWEAAYVAEKVGDDYPIDNKGNAKEHATPAAPGSDWEAGLFEHFVFEIGPFEAASFKILLGIESDAGTEHVVKYKLIQSLEGSVGPINKTSGGITLDKGSIEAKQEGAWVHVKVSKDVKFSGWGGSMLDFWVNFWSRIAIEQAADELYEGICCQPGVDIGGPIGAAHSRGVAGKLP
jgi:hypothetical protein